MLMENEFTFVSMMELLLMLLASGSAAGCLLQLFQHGTTVHAIHRPVIFSLFQYYDLSGVSIMIQVLLTRNLKYLCMWI